MRTVQRSFSFMAASLFFFCAVMPTRAQFPMMNQSGDTAPSYPAISASGTATVKRLPEMLRVIITLHGRGKTVDEAVTNLQTERQSALEKIRKIGFNEEKIRFEHFSLDQTQENQRRQMEAMIAQRMRQTGQKKPEIPESITMKCMLFAERPLVGKNVEDIFKEVDVLKQQIAAANFTAKKENMTPEEEELVEEMGGMSIYTGESEVSDEPRFIFVSKITEEEADGAYAEAFEQARKQAGFLAKAAGLERGSVMHLSANLSKNQGASSVYSHRNQDYYMMQILSTQQLGMGQPEPFEGVAATPETMTFTFFVQAVFKMSKTEKE